MKFLKCAMLFFLFINCSYAAKLDNYIKIGQQSGGKVDVGGDVLNKALTNAVKGAQDEILKKLDIEIQKLQKELDKNVADITKKFDNEIQKTTDRINNNIVVKAEKLVDDATEQYNSVIAMKDGALGMLDNLPKYLTIAKIVFGVLILGLLLLVASISLTFVKIKGLAKTILNSKDSSALESINKKLTELDKKIDKLMSSIK